MAGRPFYADEMSFNIAQFFYCFYNVVERRTRGLHDIDKGTLGKL